LAREMLEDVAEYDSDKSTPSSRAGSPVPKPSTARKAQLAQARTEQRREAVEAPGPRPPRVLSDEPPPQPIPSVLNQPPPTPPLREARRTPPPQPTPLPPIADAPRKGVPPTARLMDPKRRRQPVQITRTKPSSPKDTESTLIVKRAQFIKRTTGTNPRPLTEAQKARIRRKQAAAAQAYQATQRRRPFPAIFKQVTEPEARDEDFWSERTETASMPSTLSMTSPDTSTETSRSPSPTPESPSQE